MKRIRYLTLLVLLLGSISIWGQDDFNPDSPPEPGLPPVKLTLLADPTDGGTVSGGGKYVPGRQVTLYASGNSSFTFRNWTDSRGNVVSEVRSFSYTVGNQAETLTAHFDFTPGNPAEPLEIAQNVYYQLTVSAEEGGTVSGGGRYLPGKQVSLNASCQEGFDFAGWYNKVGELVSETVSFKYTTQACSEVLTARFYFNPSNPSEPSPAVVSHNATATAGDGGTVSISSSRVQEGKAFTVSASPNTGYVFVGWYLDGEFYTALRSFSYTMGTQDVHFKARFEFNPDSPSEPSMSQSKKYAFYMMNKVCKPGDMVEFPLYLTSLERMGDMTFQLTVPTALATDLSDVTLSAKAAGYALNCSQESDTTFVFSLLGGSVPSGNTQLLTFRISVPEDIETGVAQPIKINQVSVVDSEGENQTASTRNGRISVYKRGDTNGDNAVDVVDVVNMLAYISDDVSGEFIPEVSDMDENGHFDAADVTGIGDVILEIGGAGSNMLPLRLFRKKEADVMCDLLSVPDIVMEAGSEAVLTVELTNPLRQYTAFQLDVCLPEGISPVVNDDGSPAFELGDRIGNGFRLRSAVLGEGRLRVLCSEADRQVLDGTNGALLTLRLRAAEELERGTELLGGVNGIKFATPLPVGFDMPGIDFTISIGSRTPGDVNRDGNVTIADVTALVNIILGKDSAEPHQYDHAAADVNGDGGVTIADVTALVNVILGKGPL